MQQSGGATLGYRPEVDGLRAIAVVAVILFHAHLGVAPGGYVGVDVFFVISGYLISSIIMRESEQGRFSFVRFYERRIRRIFPALFVVLTTTTIASWFILPPEALQTFSQSLVATVAFVSNFFFWLKSGYFGGDADLFPLNHMWSLSVEEQFYIVFPFVVLIGYATRRWLLHVIVLGAFILSLALCIYVTRHHQMAAFFFTPLRAWELLAGVILAMNEARWRPALDRQRWVPILLETLGLVAIIVPVITYNNATAFPGWTAAVPVFGSALLILASRPTTPIGRLLASRPMVVIGLLSYSAYLWHQPLFALVRTTDLAQYGRPLFGALILVTFALAALTWKYIEQPFRHGGRFNRLQIFGGFFLLSGALLAFGGAGHLFKGFPDRYDADTLALNATTAYSPQRDRCHTDGLNYLKPAVSCRYLGGPARWAVFSDSHGPEIAYALAEDLKPRGEGVLHLTFSGCQPALQFESNGPGCSAWIQESMAYLERTPEITNVVMVFRYSFHLFGDEAPVYPRLPNERPKFLLDRSSDEARRAYVDSFEAMVRQLTAAGKHVYVIKPVPNLPGHVERYVFNTHRNEPGFESGVTMDYYHARNAYILPAFDQLAQIPGVTILDPVPALCDAQRCASLIDGKAMYFDANHLSVAGAHRVLDDLIARGTLSLSR
jgi:peptidoglycan/LPS O-acetylase OafA/YrhL